jgi:hypothetical protein
MIELLKIFYGVFEVVERLEEVLRWDDWAAVEAFF